MKPVIFEKKLMKKIINKNRDKLRIQHRIYNRAAHVLPEYVDMRVSIYNVNLLFL